MICKWARADFYHNPHRNLYFLGEVPDDGDDVGKAVVLDDLAGGGGHLRRSLYRVNVARPGLEKYIKEC